MLRVAMLLSMSGGYAACDSAGDEGGETHWLRHCDADSDCAVGPCTCGVCTAPCTTNDECAVYGMDAVCAPAGTAEFAAYCGDPADPAGICVRPPDAGHHGQRDAADVLAEDPPGTSDAEAPLDAQTEDVHATVVPDAAVDSQGVDGSANPPLDASTDAGIPDGNSDVGLAADAAVPPVDGGCADCAPNPGDAASPLLGMCSMDGVDGGFGTRPTTCDELLARIPVDRSLLELLVGSRWTSAGCAGPPFVNCDRVDLEADGSYSWKRASNLVETGTWALRAGSEGSGLVILSNGSVMRVETLPGGSIRFANILLGPGPKVGADSGTASFGAVQPAAAYCDLLDGPWTKTNEFELASQPQQLMYFGDGTMFESYRSCECSHESRWSFDQGVILKKPDPHDCGSSPNTGQLFSISNVQISGDVLRFDSDMTYQRGGSIPSPQTFVFDRYYRTVDLAGALELPLQVGRQTPVDLVFTNVSDHDMELVSLTISFNRWQQVDGGGVVDIVLQELASLDAIGVTLAPGETYSTSVVLTPAISGTLQFRFTPSYRDVFTQYESPKIYYDVTVLPESTADAP